MEKFILVLGESSLLEGKQWTQYLVDVTETEMVCTLKNNPSIAYKVPYESFTSAEFGIGSGNLWLQCKLGNDSLVFCSPRKSWKSEPGKLLIQKINSVTEIKDMKAYKSYTGPFFFLAMFK